MNGGIDRLRNVRGLLDEAKSSLCIGWDSTERQMDPSKVLEALTGIECAIKELDVLNRNLQEEDAECASIRAMAEALRSKGRPHQ